MLEQAYVQAGDKTTPAVKDVRARISTAVDATTGTALERFKCWLQMPADSTFANTAVKAERAVYVNGSTGHVGGDQSKFNNERNIGFHVIVLLAVGQETGGRGYFLGFDPDVSATTESRAAWKALVAGDTETKPQGFTAAKNLEVIKSMILGSAEGSFGPLVRKYYVDTTKAFPKIIRA
ncbi:hypothetical protein [Streptomyces sp. NBC_01244]|uniref:hypothetical protein n=1 Tax=Streptomyces sp. NBC_01244 TaxID=2903797 RepID=UPI002E121F41|nr:hypothetical protein OG247_41670 [Streptomyces sp. NBC_01244]